MKKEFTEQEVNWKSISIYIDIDTGELIGKTTAQKEYITINKKKEKHVYRKRGTITYTNECRKRKYTQTSLF